MLLKDKNAIIYGAGGSVGGAVASAFASEGAKVFLIGRTKASLDAIAKEIIDAGGTAEIAIVDALDEKEVNDYLDTVLSKAGSIDISFNAIGLEDVQGLTILDLSQEDFMRPVTIAMSTQFITAKAAAKHMIRQKAGVILSITATPAGKPYTLVGGFGPVCSAIEGFSRNLAAELGPYGVRVVCLRSAGSPDSAVFIKAAAQEGALAKMPLKNIVEDTMLGRLPSLCDVANVAVFMASDKAAGITGSIANVTCGTTFY